MPNDSSNFSLLHKKITTDVLASARRTLSSEQNALSVLSAQLDERFIQACEVMYNCRGRVVVTGMGKSGLIGRKIAATLASTGTPAFFLHPGEAAHGDLGMLVPGDVLVAISNSGRSDEILKLLPVVQHYNIPLISISQGLKGPLPELATVALTLGDITEACPLGLAPTSSTTATLALGDALAVALLEQREFTSDDFALSHPAGALGKKLLTRVRDIMHTGEALPIVRTGSMVQDALPEMTTKRLGMTAVVDENDQLAGVFTDGDLRRLILNRRGFDQLIEEVMTRSPLCVASDLRATEALALMRNRQINQLLVTDAEGKLTGAFNIHDLFAAGVQ